MTGHTHDVAVVLVLAGHDPSGGAGIQADIETLASLRCHATPVITALTAQNTQRLVSVHPADPSEFSEQVSLLMADIQPQALKIGLLTNVSIVRRIHELVLDHPNIPVILDPVLSAGTGQQLADDTVVEAVVELLLPLTTVLTPNSDEARRLASHSEDVNSAAEKLMNQGCKFVLITGTHEPTATVVNQLYGEGQHLKTFEWRRLAGKYHGSGCTLSAAIAGLIARGLDVNAAVEQAQAYTWAALRHARRLGSGQHHPNRLFWGRYRWDHT